MNLMKNTSAISSFIKPLIMHKGILKTGLLISALSVLLGAFAAHALKKIVEPSSLATFETGVKYQFYHAFAMLISGVLYAAFNQKMILKAYYFFFTGVILFCGSLYFLTILPNYSWQELLEVNTEQNPG